LHEEKKSPEAYLMLLNYQAHQMIEERWRHSNEFKSTQQPKKGLQWLHSSLLWREEEDATPFFSKAKTLHNFIYAQKL